MLKYLLDTNICIYTIKNKPPEVRALFNEHQAQLCMSAITLMELIYGAEKSAAPARNMAVVEGFSARLVVLDYDASAAAHSGQLRAELAAEGRPICPYDQMIAGRLVLNLWDNEEGYYNASTYYGEKQILAIGLSYQDGAGSGGGTNYDHDGDPLTDNVSSEDALQVDVLVEKTLDSVGTVTLDVAWYDIDGIEDDTTSVFVGLLLNNEISLGPLSGKIRPYIRSVQDGVRGDETSFGIQHVLDGHKASLTVEISDTDTHGNAIGIGAQFQF